MGSYGKSRNQTLREKERDNALSMVNKGVKPKVVQVHRTNDKKAKRWDAIIQRIPFDQDTIGAEVGVWQGDTCEKVLAQRPNCTLYLIDRWAPPSKEDSYASSGAKIAGYSDTIHQRAYKSVLNRIKPFDKRAILLIGNTVDMAKEIDDRGLDFAFIDADHSYVGVTQDIAAYLPKIKIGGWLGGHDWNAQWPVEQAVLKFFPRNRIQLDSNSTWFIQITEEDLTLFEEMYGSFEQIEEEEEKNGPVTNDEFIETVENT